MDLIYKLNNKDEVTNDLISFVKSNIFSNNRYDISLDYKKYVKDILEDFEKLMNSNGIKLEIFHTEFNKEQYDDSIRDEMILLLGDIFEKYILFPFNNNYKDIHSEELYCLVYENKNEKYKNMLYKLHDILVTEHEKTHILMLKNTLTKEIDIIPPEGGNISGGN